MRLLQIKIFFNKVNENTVYAFSYLSLTIIGHFFFNIMKLSHCK